MSNYCFVLECYNSFSEVKPSMRSSHELDFSEVPIIQKYFQADLN